MREPAGRALLLRAMQRPSHSMSLAILQDTPLSPDQALTANCFAASASASVHIALRSLTSKPSVGTVCLPRPLPDQTGCFPRPCPRNIALQLYRDMVQRSAHIFEITSEMIKELTLPGFFFFDTTTRTTCELPIHATAFDSTCNPTTHTPTQTSTHD